MVRTDLIGQQVDVMVGEQGRRRTITLNKRVQPSPQEMAQQQAQAQVINDVRSTKVKVALDDVPSTSAYREQQFTMLAELTKGLPPQLQAVIAPFVVEASDLQRRREMADQLRKAMGQPIPKSPEEERAAEAAQMEAMQFTAEITRKAALQEIAERDAKIEKTRAEAAKIRAEAQAATMGDGGAAALEARAKMEQQVAQIEQQARDNIDKLTAELMQVRMQAGQREQKLLGELAKTVAELKANAANVGAQEREAKLKKEIAQIEAEKDKEVARIQAASQQVIDAMAEQWTKLREEFNKKLDAQAEQSRKDREQALKDAAKAADSKAKAAPAGAPQDINVNVSLGAGAEPAVEEKSVVVEKTADGKFVGTMTTKTGKKKTIEVRGGKPKGAK
jgi:hypothetical protein